MSVKGFTVVNGELKHVVALESTSNLLYVLTMQLRYTETYLCL